MSRHDLSTSIQGISGLPELFELVGDESPRRDEMVGPEKVLLEPFVRRLSGDGGASALVVVVVHAGVDPGTRWSGQEGRRLQPR